MKKLLLLIIILAILTLAIKPIWYKKNGPYILSNYESDLLSILGDSAIQSRDVPVAALVVYENRIIGTGYNTVNRKGNIGGHAEINAISDAVNKSGGLIKFNALDRNKLSLITTFEPCRMCEGAVIEYFIKHVIVVKMKPMKHWLKKIKMQYIYQWHKQHTQTDTLQDYLFVKHPDYHKQKHN